MSHNQQHPQSDDPPRTRFITAVTQNVLARFVADALMRLVQHVW